MRNKFPKGPAFFSHGNGEDSYFTFVSGSGRGSGYNIGNEIGNGLGEVYSLMGSLYDSPWLWDYQYPDALIQYWRWK